jgi:hypothetical protein
MTRPANGDEIARKVASGEAWREFCRALEQAGEAVLAPGNPEDAFERAEGYRMLTRLLRGALESQLEFATPTHPQLVCTCHETIKIVAENPDNLYLGASIDGRHDYRIWGTRGQARWLSFNTFAGAGFGGGTRGTGTTLHERELAIGPDGSFELILSQRQHPGNWLRLEPDTRSLTVRQTFLDKRRDRPAELHIERLGADGAPPPPLDPAHLYRALLGAARYVRSVTEIGASWTRRQAAHPNVFANVQQDDTFKFKDPQITWNQAYFELGPDDALWIEFLPPPCDYWMIALHNFWTETLDYRYHRITLNNHSAKLEPDGSARFVIAQRDPGHPNWLDPAGHARGIVGVRWVGENVPNVIPRTRLVRPADSPAGA